MGYSCGRGTIQVKWILMGEIGILNRNVVRIDNYTLIFIRHVRLRN